MNEENFTLLEKISEGGFGEVYKTSYKCPYTTATRELALKRLFLNDTVGINKSTDKDVRNEVEIINHLQDCVHIIRHYGSLRYETHGSNNNYTIVHKTFQMTHTHTHIYIYIYNS